MLINNLESLHVLFFRDGTKFIKCLQIMNFQDKIITMSWFADLAGKAENLLNNLDEQTGVALRNHNVAKPKKQERHETFHQDVGTGQRRRPTGRTSKKVSTSTENRATDTPSRKPSPIYHQSRSPSKDSQELTIKTPRNRKSPTRKPNTQFSLNNCPRTLVGDIRDNDIDDQYGLKQRSKLSSIF